MLAQRRQPFGDGLADLGGRVFLDEVVAGDRDLALVRPGAAELALVPQIVSIVAVVVWSLVTGFALFFLLKFTMGVRVSEQEEMQGLDISEHGIQTYPESAATS